MNASALRRQRHKDELRASILVGAREIFVNEGYESFSMRKLAAQLDCSPGNIYLHFRNKEELFESIVEESFAHLLASLSKLKNGAKGGDPVDLLREGLHIYVEFGLRNSNDYRFAFLLRRPIIEQADVNVPYRVHPAFEEMRSMVGRCITEKRFRALDVETCSQALWAAAHGITSLLIQRPAFPWVGRAKVIDRVIDSAIDSLTICNQESRQSSEEGAHDASNRRTATR